MNWWQKENRKEKKETIWNIACKFFVSWLLFLLPSFLYDCINDTLNKAWHFMWIVCLVEDGSVICLADNSHEKSTFTFLED